VQLHLVLNANELLALQDLEGESGSNAFADWGGAAAGTHRIQVVVDSDAGDVLALSDRAAWSSGGTVTHEGTNYTALNHSSMALQILLDQTVNASSVI
jgi:hypothetical protein